MLNKKKKRLAYETVCSPVLISLFHEGPLYSHVALHQLLRTWLVLSPEHAAGSPFLSVLLSVPKDVHSPPFY